MTKLPSPSSLPKLPSKMPLADVHQHLDAMISMDLLQKFAKAKNLDLPSSFDGGQYSVDSDDITKFLEQFFHDYDDLNDLYIKGEDEYKQLIKDYLYNMYSNGVIYTDIMFSPAHAEISGMRFEKMLEVVTKAIDEVRADTNDGIVATLSMTAVNAPSFIPRKPNQGDESLGIDSNTKRYGPKEIEIFLDEFNEIKSRRPAIAKYVTSFGIAGAEGLCLDKNGIPIDTSSDTALPNQFAPFATAFKTALDSGLTLRAHAGEGKGVKSVWDLVKTFKEIGVEENFVLDHGLEVANDAELTKYIADREIYFTNTFSSNMILNSYDTHNHVKHDMSTHPIFDLKNSGISANRIGLGGDDNVFFVPASGSGVKYNYQLLLSEEQKRDRNFDVGTLLEYTKAAANMPFVPDDIKQSLNDKIANYESVMKTINTSQAGLGK